MLYATQVHPHDVRDEGAAHVIKRIQATGIKVIAAETGTLAERHPYPHGELPHNPRHQVVITRANLEVPLNENTFADLPIRPRTLPAPDDYIAALQEAARGTGIQIVPWIKGLNGSFSGNSVDNAVRTLDGRSVDGWLCPCKPETAAFLARLVIAIAKHFRSPAVLLDRVRYPDWSGAEVNTDQLLTCFCPTCRSKMDEQGIDVLRLGQELRVFMADLSAGDAPNRVSRHAMSSGIIGQWVKFRQAAVTQLVRHVRDAMQEAGVGHVTFWLNLWSPAFAWILGQDYTALGRLCHGAKHFPYHRLGGGADLAGLVRALASDAHQANQNRIFRNVLSLFDLPYDITFARFLDVGLPVEFVATETAAAKHAFGSTPAFTGIQMWDVPKSDIVEATEKARQAGADGYFFYCYGWATFDALDTVGQLIYDSR